MTRTPIQLQFNSKIGLRLNWIESNSIEGKWDANLWRRYEKYIYEYGVGKKLLKDTNVKRHLISFLFIWVWAK